MRNGKVAPSQLHHLLQQARTLDADGRFHTLVEVLSANNLKMIRKIPELLSPLSDDEKAAVVRWANKETEEDDVSHRDFAFHLMVLCGVPAQTILEILERNKTFSRSAIEHIQTIIGNDEAGRLDSYLRQVAEGLLSEQRTPSRDRGRHILMTLAVSESDWYECAKRFSEDHLHDLRQRVIERFLSDCPDGPALLLFVSNVVRMCLTKFEDEVVLEKAGVSRMHWVISCLERVSEQRRLQEVCDRFRLKYGVIRYGGLPRSVVWRMPETVSAEDMLKESKLSDDVFPAPKVKEQPKPAPRPEPVRFDATQDSRPSSSIGKMVAPEPPKLVMEWKPRDERPILVISPDKRETNAEIASRLGLTKQQVIALKRAGKANQLAQG